MKNAISIQISNFPKLYLFEIQKQLIAEICFHFPLVSDSLYSLNLPITNFKIQTKNNFTVNVQSFADWLIGFEKNLPYLNFKTI